MPFLSLCVYALALHCSALLCSFQHIPKSALYFTVNLCATTLAKNNDIRAPNLKVHADPLEFVKRLAEMAPAPATAGAKAVTATSAPTAAASSSSSSSSSASPAAVVVGGGAGGAWFSFLQSQQLSREQEIDAMANKESGRKLTDASGGSFVNPLRLCRILDELLPERSIIVADGGDFVGTASYTVKPRHPLSWLDPGVFGTLGVGAGFALASKLACPSETVVLIWGDGASGYGLVEFDTYVRMKTPIIAIIGMAPSRWHVASRGVCVFELCACGSALRVCAPVCSPRSTSDSICFHFLPVINIFLR